MLNEKALEAARNSVMRSTGHTTFEKSVELSITAYFAALPSSPVSGLVDALNEWAKPDTGSRDAGVQLVCTQAADRLTALEAENARLRGHIVEAQKILCEPQDEMVRLIRATITLAQAIAAPQGGDHGE